MATLKELCNSIPEAVLESQRKLERERVMCEVARRKAASYLYRMDSLCQEHRVFEQCKQSRPTKGKYKNRFSREEAGTQGTIVAGLYLGNYTVCVCRTTKKI